MSPLIRLSEETMWSRLNTQLFMPPLDKHYAITCYFMKPSRVFYIWCRKSLKDPNKRRWTFLLLLSFIWCRFKYLLAEFFVIQSLFCFISLAPLLGKNKSELSRWDYEIQLTNRGNKTNQNNFLIWHSLVVYTAFTHDSWKGYTLAFWKKRV